MGFNSGFKGLNIANDGTQLANTCFGLYDGHHQVVRLSEN